MPSATGMAQDAIGFGAFSMLDQAHAAIAGDGEPLVEAEMRDLDAGLLAGLQHRRACRDLDLLPSMVSFGIVAYSAASRARDARYSRDAPLHLGPEMPDQALHRPRRGVAERADRVALDLVRHFVQHVDLGDGRRGP